MIARARTAVLLLPLLLALPAAARAQAQALVADLSDHLIEVTTGFRGAKLLLFGAIEGEGQVVVAVRGPSRRTVVRRKDRVAGIWMNTEQEVFPDAPSFYSVASSQPLDEIADSYVLARYQLGVQHLNLPAGAQPPGASTVDFRQALIRNRIEQGFYRMRPGEVTFLGHRLFRTDVVFPSDVPTGLYAVTVYLFRDGGVVSAQTTPLVVSKAGIGAQVTEIAKERPAFYGLGAIAVALFAGWFASWLANVFYPRA